MNMERNHRQAAREHLVTAMLEGQTWQQVSTGFPMPVKRAMAYRLLHAVRIKGDIARPRWAAWSSCQTVWSSSHLPGRILSTSTFHTKSADPNAAARAFWFESEHQPDQPRPSSPRSEQLPKDQDSGKKTQEKLSISLTLSSGRKGLAACCYLLLPMKQAYSHAFQQHSRPTCSLLIHCRVSPTASPQRCVASCSRCSS